jgi:hypothetical protein
VLDGECDDWRKAMAKKRTRKYSPSAGADVADEMRRYERGTAKSGKGGKGGKVKSRAQASHCHRPVEGAQGRQEGATEGGVKAGLWRRPFSQLCKPDSLTRERPVTSVRAVGRAMP